MPPFYHPLWVAGRGEAPPEIAGIGHSILSDLGDPTGTFNTVFILRTTPLNKCPFFTLWGVAGKGKAPLKIVDIIHSVLREPQNKF